MKKYISVVLAASAASLMLTPMANAEGYFESSMHGVRSGFSTRQWVDRNVDGYNTEITASRCLNNPHGSPGKVEFTLRRKVSLRPDVNMGTRNLNGCYGSWARGGWGRVTAGTYYASVGTYDWNRLTVNWLKVIY